MRKTTAAAPKTTAPIAAALTASSHSAGILRVEIAYEVIQLLSEQLYATPLKAIEELVVNSWDADATECRIYVPTPNDLAARKPPPFVAVLDNGHGMTLAELRELWHVGESPKRRAEWVKRAKRKQIGKFGIGKLASYVIARRVTYITRSAKRDDLRGVTLDFERFRSARRADGAVEPIDLEMLRIPDVKVLLENESVAAAVRALGATEKNLAQRWDSWTLVVLEELKEKAREIKLGRLRWVLRTAMPLSSGFALYLNGTRAESSRTEYNWIVDFSVSELEAPRIESLAEKTGVRWSPRRDSLVSSFFPSGVTGRVKVADRSLYAAAGKSEDLGRSHGFFIRVRNRLVNEDDALFGALPVSFTTFYNLFAEIEADDLDTYLKAPRDDIEDAPERLQFRMLLEELFRQARARYETFLREEAERERDSKEGQRNYVDTRLVERPVADALVNYREDYEPPARWVYLKADTSPEAIQGLVANLYADQPVRRQYAYRYRSAGKAAPLVEFDPAESTFWLNEDHDLVVEHHEDIKSRRLLEAVVTAEALLEVYMRELGLVHALIEHLLSRRDELLRSLAHDELYSLTAIGASLESAVDSATELEIAVVAALRALGFGTQHISGSGTPDGIAEYIIYGVRDTTFTLEAKSSKDVPTLATLNFAMLREHYEQIGANGCMLVAPRFPGATKGNDSAVANMAERQRISCWTVEQLARVVRVAEARHINADQIQGIVFKDFAPAQVEASVERLLTEPSWDQKHLYRAIIETLKRLSTVLQSSPRDVGMLTGQIALAGFTGIERQDVKDAIEQLAKASQGMLHLTKGERIHVSGSLDELSRRVGYLTGDVAAPRRKGSFRTVDEKG